MDAYITDTIINVISLVIVCATFYGCILSLTVKHDNQRLKLLGATLLTPCLLAAASIVVRNSISFNLWGFAATVFLMATLFSFIVRPDTKNFAFLRALILAVPFFVVPAAFAVASVISVDAAAEVAAPGGLVGFYMVGSILTVILSVVIAILAKVKGKSGGKLNYALFFIAAGSLCRLLCNLPYRQLLYHGFIMIAFILFTVYVAQKIMDEFTKKISDAEKMVKVMNRYLDVEVKKRTMEIERVNERLVSVSKTDPLTGVMNRAGLFEAVDKLIRDQIKKFSILMFDIDDFKTVNDSMGHAEGDKCIRRLALIARGTIRDIDRLGRYGGDEFIIILPGTNATQAKHVAERLRKKVEETSQPHFTISVGVASYPTDAKDSKNLITFADEGMYVSKERGKNQVSYKGDAS